MCIYIVIYYNNSKMYRFPYCLLIQVPDFKTLKVVSPGPMTFNSQNQSVGSEKTREVAGVSEN